MMTDARNTRRRERRSSRQRRVPDEQLGFTLPMQDESPPHPHELLPNNYAHGTAGSIIEGDMRTSKRQLLITGFTSLEKLVGYLASYYGHGEDIQQLRLLLGHELVAAERTWRWQRTLSQEITDFWLEEGISVTMCPKVIAAIDVLRRGKETGTIEVRTSDRRVIHAKIYKSEETIVTGSSNFSHAGFAQQIESNVRFMRTEHAVWAEPLDAYAEWVWMQGRDYMDGLLTLLRQLLAVVTWREALARACAEVLEGDWAKEYIRPDAAREVIPLWPTQRQGIAQALWIMENLGSVLVADPTGSGKTRMGAHLLASVVDRLVQTGRRRASLPVLTCPQSVVDSWREALNGLLGVELYTHGELSSTGARKAAMIDRALKHAQVFAVDEAHNFLDRTSRRTRTLYGNMADTVVLFTATPINKGARDLMALIDVLGADNFDADTLSLLDGMLKRGGGEGAMTEDERTQLRHAIERFMVRRTMAMLNRAIDHDPDRYRDVYGQRCRYPDQRAQTYDGGDTEDDLEIVRRIRAEAERLKGLVNLGRNVAPFRSRDEEWYWVARRPEEELALRLKMARNLAVYQVMSCLRSSRAALIEHIYGTERAMRGFGLVGTIKTTASGDFVGKLQSLAGKVPDNGFGIPLPTWLSDPDEHAHACREDAATYERIAQLTQHLSNAREEAKASVLADLLQRHSKIVAFDWHVITLSDLKRRLLSRGIDQVFVATGSDPTERARVRALFDHDRLPERDGSAIALCSEAMSESIGLQRASAMMHLDMPSTIRRAEQRTGRVVRMNSPHPIVTVLWPKDADAYALRLDARLVERHRTVDELIGANLVLPADLCDELYAADHLILGADEQRTGQWDDLRDAFAPVRSLVEGNAALVPADVYERLRTSTARVVSSVSVVEAATPWAFFAIAGTEWGAPQWVLLDGETSTPVVDLDAVAERVRNRLGPEAIDRTLDETAAAVLTHFLTQVAQTEVLLLPKKKQRALEQMETVLERYRVEAVRAGDVERARLVRELAALPRAQFEDRAVDLRTLADCWLSVIAPIWAARLAHPGRVRPLRLRDIDGDLLQERRITTEALRAAFDGAPLWIKPLDKRIVSTIIGVP